ncbi:RNA binding motif, single stranded interacting protein 3 [Chytridiales sp. JEL 0842]|nr:RNA binding motif, single stranded interacting protein 3 [Chytridiales sp. JEL 0842]
MKNVYVRGLAKETTDANLFNLCKEFGTITSHKAITDKATKACKGYGFVMYQTIEESRVALDELRKLGYRVSFAKSGPRPRTTKKAFNGFPNCNQPTPFQAPPEYSPTLPYVPLPAYIPSTPSHYPETYYYVLPPGSTIWTGQGWTQTTVPLYYPANAPLPAHIYPNPAFWGPLYVPMQQGWGYGCYYPPFGANVGSGGYYGVPAEVLPVGMGAVPESPSVSEGDMTIGVVSPTRGAVYPPTDSEDSRKQETVEQSPLEEGVDNENGDEEDAEGCLSNASNVTVTAGNCGSSSSLTLPKGSLIDKAEVESLVEGLNKLGVENQREAGVVA